MSKMMSTLSNLLKKISDTCQSITQNLKLFLAEGAARVE